MTRAPALSLRHEIRVRYAETDQMGIVYHANHLIWFHEARDALFRQLDLPPDQVEHGGLRFPVVDVSCRYHAPARYGDILAVQVTLHPQAVARIELSYAVTKAKGAQLVATGRTVSAITDHNGRMLLRLPPMLALALARAQAEPGKAAAAQLTEITPAQEGAC
jgi:acyl-CoA thioester hydrolase